MNAHELDQLRADLDWLGDAWFRQGGEFECQKVWLAEKHLAFSTDPVHLLTALRHLTDVLIERIDR